MDRAVGHRVELHVAGQRAFGLSADLDLDDRVQEVTGLQHLDQGLRLDMDLHGFLLVAVNHGGYAAFATDCTGGSLACPVARFSRELQRFTHSVSLHFFDPRGRLQG